MKIKQTMPVILKDLSEGPRKTIQHFILYSLYEGAEIKALACFNENSADEYLKEFERSGTLRVLRGFEGEGLAEPRYEILEPIVVIKVNYADGARKHFRVVEMDDPNLIEAEADTIKGLED